MLHLVGDLFDVKMLALCEWVCTEAYWSISERSHLYMYVIEAVYTRCMNKRKAIPFSVAAV